MQDVLHNGPLEAGLKILVWTGATMIVAPFAGIFSQRFGSRPFMLSGLALQAGALAWLASILSTDTPYGEMIVPFIMAGAGMALVFAPSANAVLSAVRANQAGQASGATNAIRETGGVLGVAVLATIFTHAGGYSSPQAFVNGLGPALWVAVAVLSAGTLAVLALPFSTKAAGTEPAAEEVGIAEAGGQRGSVRGVPHRAGVVGEAA
jgi:MFS family permease